ncbi:MAG: malate dehydrogenase [Candidatus Alkanophagales archaeon]|nr:MAG: malate dehydrogenase [Candidatus Alkanophagales archaeon]
MQFSEDERLRRAELPKQRAKEYHRLYKGKIEISLKVPVRSYDDFAIWYTPGVAEPCLEIKENEDAVFEYTNRGNTVAIVTDGTRILGLGDIGAAAGLPVMEGKALLFKYLGGVDAIPICLGTKNAAEIISAVRWLSPTFGGINLEDIETPKCFGILETLREKLEIPVWHDDQQGTALVTLAALINALKVVGKDLKDVKIAFVGAGAAGISCFKYVVKAGARPKNIVMCDSKGILHPARKDLSDEKRRVAELTSPEGAGGIAEALEGADVCISMARPGPGVIKKEWLRRMNDGAVSFNCANPVPEIWPWEAKEAGVKIVGTGRSDFENQINNALGFPAVFRGALDVAARKITDEMCLAAARAIAEFADERGLSESYIIPKLEETEVFIREAVAVGLEAMKQGVARKKLSKQELKEAAATKIKRAQEILKLLMREGLVRLP